MQTRLFNEPVLVKTSLNNTQDSVPGTSYITGNPPNITYAGGRPIYAQQGTDVTFNNLTLTGSFITNSLSVSSITAASANVSSITAGDAILTRLDLDGNILTTAGVGTGGELLLNGVPIATTSNISSLADWAYEPAISTVNFNFNDLTNVSTINGAPYASFSPVLLGNWANYKAISTIDANSQPMINTGRILFNSATSNILTTDEANNLIYNGSNISGGGSGNVADWATFPANSNVAMNGNILTSATASGFTIDAGGSALTTPQINLTSVNGNGGNVSILADTGYLGTSFGKVSIVANGGTTLGVGVGGLVEITANTPSGADATASSAIKLSAAGINSYAGAVPTIGSLAGYNFVYGTSGVNVCSGLPSVLPSFPGCTYIYGTAGIQLNSDVYTSAILPYWNGITADVENLVIAGRDAVPLVHGPAFVVLENVSTINGVVPSAGGWVGTATSALDMSNYGINNISSLEGVSSINGAVYPPPASATWVGTATSELNMADFGITNVSTINGFVPGTTAVSVSPFDVLWSPTGTDVAGITTGAVGNVLTLVSVDMDTKPIWTAPATYTPPVPVIQAGGTNALTPANANTTFILTSGTTQDFTSSGLASGDAGLVWYVKNAQPDGGAGNDIAVSHNGTAITGETSTLHQRTNTTNTGSQVLYWTGTDLIMY